MPPLPHPGIEKSEQITKKIIEEASEASAFIESFLNGAVEEMNGEISAVASQRMQRVTGESDLASQLRVLGEIYDTLSLEVRGQAILYVAGYPPRSLVELGGDDIRRTIARLESIGSRRVYEARRQAAQKAMAETATHASPYRSIHDPSTQTERWDLQAACAGKPIAMFFPERGKSSDDAKKICATCDVREPCLEEELRSPQQFGVRGGLSENERRLLLRRARRASRRQAQ